MAELIARVLQQACFEKEPPVLVDVGASGGLPAEWSSLARHSICIGFDADTRDFEVRKVENSAYRVQYLVNRLIAPRSADKCDFYLTRSPHCSSSLQPTPEKMAGWLFRDLFECQQVTNMPGIALADALTELKVGRIDWLKLDTQGTDLRIFLSLPDALADDMTVVDFEPGIIDAYRGEDKLHDVLRAMEQRPFWLSDMHVKGSRRIGAAEAEFVGLRSSEIDVRLRPTPGWCEISYLNDLSAKAGERDLYLAWIAATIKRQHGFALQAALNGVAHHGGGLFAQLRDSSQRAIRRGVSGRLYTLAARVRRLRWKL